MELSSRARPIYVSMFVAAMLVAATAAQTRAPAAPAKRKAVPTAAMTDADVIKMVNAGLADDLIITSIRQAPQRRFDLSVEGLVVLKQAKVSNAVIREMQSPQGTSTAAVEPPRPAGASPPIPPTNPSPTPPTRPSGPAAKPSVAATTLEPGVPVYQQNAVPPALQQEFERQHWKRDPRSGNYLSPKVFAKTLDQDMVPVLINGKYARDLQGHTVFLRQSIRDKLLSADAAMFSKKQKHIVINYGFRSNALQGELFQKLSGKGKVARAGGSFHETGMALDLSNWQDAQKFMIEAGFVGGCYGIEEDLVHYSVGEITKASNAEAFKRCTLKEIPEAILKGLKKVGGATLGRFKRKE